MEQSKIWATVGVIAIVVVAAIVWASIPDGETQNDSDGDDSNEQIPEFSYIIRYRVLDAVWNEDHSNMYIDIEWIDPVPRGVEVYVTCGSYNLGTDFTSGLSTMTINTQNQQLGGPYTMENLELYIPGHQLIKI